MWYLIPNLIFEEMGELALLLQCCFELSQIPDRFSYFKGSHNLWLFQIDMKDYIELLGLEYSKAKRTRSKCTSFYAICMIVSYLSLFFFYFLSFFVI